MAASEMQRRGRVCMGRAVEGSSADREVVLVGMEADPHFVNHDVVRTNIRIQGHDQDDRVAHRPIAPGTEATSSAPLGYRYFREPFSFLGSCAIWSDAARKIALAKEVHPHPHNRSY